MKRQQVSRQSGSDTILKKSSDELDEILIVWVLIPGFVNQNFANTDIIGYARTGPLPLLDLFNVLITFQKIYTK